MSDLLAIIPARGGSKRIPHKNIRSFCGKPMIAYSIEAALQSGLFKKVVVSTDSPQIAEIAQKLGAEVPFMRPAALADDFAGHAEVLMHVLEELGKTETLPTYFCCLYATAPFVCPDFLKEGFETLVRLQVDGVFSVGEFGASIFRALQKNSDGTLKPIWPEFVNKRSNDLPSTYHDAGQFYWYKTQAFLTEKQAWPMRSAPLILPRHTVQDIDTPADWEFAEQLFKLNKNIK
ncbi:pseudaminic acid cytidylyltransferase [bacterium]|nr:pseudaminic acid cytidylyltransferase [bacterium]